MKIIFYIDEMSRGGAQRVMSNIVNYCCQENDEVILVNDFKCINGQEFFVDDRAKRIFLRESVAGNPIIKNFERIIRLRKVVKREQPSVVLSFLGNTNLRMLIATVGLKTTKCVSVRNDPFREYGRTKFKKFIVGLIFRLADKCVFQTEDVSSYFPDKVRTKSTIILNPVDDSFYVNELIVERHDVVSLGRLESQKNHKLLIEAFDMIKDEFPEDNLLIFGEGVLKSELSALICKNTLNERVKLCGNVSDVIGNIKNAKCFVLTSDYEGLPNALMEAMAIGIPVVSTDCPCGGPRTLINTEEEGLLVPVGDRIALSDAMRKILSNSMLQEKMCVSERKRAEDFRGREILKQWHVFLQ